MALSKAICAIFLSLSFLFFVFCLFRAALVACGGSQAKGQIGAVAASLCHSHSNAGSEPQLQPTPQRWQCRILNPLRPGIEPTSSWMLVKFNNHQAMMGTHGSISLNSICSLFISVSHFGDPCNISNFGIIILYLLWWSVIRDLWCYYCNCLGCHEQCPCKMVNLFNKCVCSDCWYGECFGDLERRSNQPQHALKPQSNPEKGPKFLKFYEGWEMWESCRRIFWS